MKTITIDTVLVEDVHDDASYDYVVKNDAHLLLVLLMIDQKRGIDAHATVRLGGKGASTSIIGLAVGKETSSMKLHTLQHHQAPETTSNLLVKGVFRDTATFLYDGAIRVEKDAQKTDAYQRNENLLLSPGVFAESKPSLEILANDVRCTHGATMSSLSQDQLWYLAARGIARPDASRLLVSGFLESALTDIPLIHKDGIVHRVLAAV